MDTLIINDLLIKIDLMKVTLDEAKYNLISQNRIDMDTRFFISELINAFSEEEQVKWVSVFGQTLFNYITSPTEAVKEALQLRKL